MVKRAFTLIEALVSATIVGVGVAAAVGAFGALSHRQALLIQKETMRELAIEKLQELTATRDLTTPNGDFQDRNETRYVWDATTYQSGVTNLTTFQVTVRLSDGNSSDDPQETVTGLIFEPPATTDTGATGG